MRLIIKVSKYNHFGRHNGDGHGTGPLAFEASFGKSGMHYTGYGDGWGNSCGGGRGAGAYFVMSFNDQKSPDLQEAS